MPESTLLKQILSDYCALNEEHKFQEGILANFCKYAAQWLVDSSCLGLGHAPTGLSLRFADGRELSLFSVPESPLANAPAVSISTAKDKLVTKTAGDTSQAFQITGRQ
ncbi:hypothetical protein EBT16_12810 [bacterium]|nr:hypothetical protein [bacterium]